MRLWKSMAIALAMACLLTGCWQEELPEEPEDVLPPFEEEPEEESQAALPERFALPYMPGRSLDPVDCADGMQQVAASLLYEGLFRLDGSFEPQPCLCISYTHDETASRYTFSLRPGVQFSDGSPLTGRDVKSALERARASERYRSRLSGITSISASGDSVTISLNAPNTAFPALLDVPIAKPGGQEGGGVPLGTGPYFFAGEETGAYLIANQSWWRGEDQPVDRIALVEAPDEAAMLYRFSSHEVQLITADLTGVTAVSTTGSVGCVDAETTVLQYVGCNTSRAPLDSPALRRSLSAGINRANVASAYLSGHGRPCAFPVSPVSSLYPADLEEGGSLEAFASALAESGYVPERPLSLLVNEENSFKKAIAQYLAESWTAGGIPVEVRVLPWEEYASALAAGDFDLYYGEARLTADWDLGSLLEPAGALNYGHWSNPDTSRLLAELAGAADRAVAMRALCAHLKDQAPILPVCFKSSSVLTQAEVVEGLRPTAAEPFYALGQCVIHLEEE